VAFSAVGLGFLLDEQTEWIFSILAVLFGLWALILSWRQHRSKRIAALLILGVVGLIVSRGLEMGAEHHDEEVHHSEVHAEHQDPHSEAHEDVSHLAGAVIGVLAGLILLVGHLSNIREAHRCVEESCE